MKLLLLSLFPIIMGFTPDTNQCNQVNPYILYTNCNKPVVHKKAQKNTVVKSETIKEVTPSTKTKVIDQDQISTQSTNVNVNNNIIQPSNTRIIERVIIREVPSKVAPAVYVQHANIISVMIGMSKTSINTTQLDCCQTVSKTAYQPDLGILYTHSFGTLAGSVMGTMNANFYVGLGFSF